ncbi:hypothetical protein Ciccas_005481 [Cichlidogyrus casuarinus]|uniref:Uncharacterized protein n=1 Tax=Cichlidogyrus casuarinus TaxID=1844966 RepID=A0ABD2Q8Z6_9PLAT
MNLFARILSGKSTFNLLFYYLRLGQFVDQVDWRSEKTDRLALFFHCVYGDFLGKEERELIELDYIAFSGRDLDAVKLKHFLYHLLLQSHNDITFAAVRKLLRKFTNKKLTIENVRNVLETEVNVPYREKVLKRAFTDAVESTQLAMAVDTACEIICDLLIAAKSDEICQNLAHHFELVPECAMKAKQLMCEYNWNFQRLESVQKETTLIEFVLTKFTKLRHRNQLVKEFQQSKAQINTIG